MTKGDFYVVEEKNLLWIGSVFFNAHNIIRADPSKLLVIDKLVRSRYYLECLIRLTKNQLIYEKCVNYYLKSFISVDARLPKDGWPYSWNTSKITDFIYVFMDNQVYVDYQKQNKDDEICFIPISCLNFEGKHKEIKDEKYFKLPVLGTNDLIK